MIFRKNNKFLIDLSMRFAYFLSITILSTFSTIVLHELGHFLFGFLAGCKDLSIILFDTTMMTAYTRMECPSNINRTLLGISGFFIILPIFLIFLCFVKTPDKYLGLIILGFNIMISAWDFKTFLNLENLELLNFLGILIIALGEILLMEKAII